MTAKRSLKSRFPGFCSTYIADKRGLGYNVHTLTKSLELDPVWYDQLASASMLTDMPWLPRSFWESVIVSHSDVRGNYIRGNAYPAAIDQSVFTDDLITALQSICTADVANALMPLVYNVLMKTGLWKVNVVPQNVPVLPSAIDNPIPSMLGGFSTSVIPRIIFTHALENCIQLLMDNVSSYIGWGDAGSKPNVRITDLAAGLALSWHRFCVELASRKQLLVELHSALCQVIGYAVRNDDYVPEVCSQDDLCYMLTFGNVLVGSSFPTWIPSKPSLSTENRYKQAIGMFKAALASKSSLYEALPVSGLAALIDQYEVQTTGETPVRTIHVTEWYIPRSIGVAGAYMPQYTSGSTGTYFVRPTPQSVASVSEALAPLTAISNMIEEKWSRTSHAFTLSGQNWLSRLSDAVPYSSKDFMDSVLTMLAAAGSRTVRYDSGFVFEVTGWEDTIVAPHDGKEQRYVFTTSAADAVAQLPIGSGTKATAYKNTSLTALLKADSIVEMSSALHSVYTILGVPLAASGRPTPSAAPAVQASIYATDLQPLSVKLRLYSWLKIPEETCVESYMERTLMATAIDKIIARQIDTITALPVTGPTASYYARTLKLELFRALDAAAQRQFGTILQNIQANYTGWQPMFWSQGATQSARIVKQQAGLEVYTKLLDSLGFSTGSALRTFVNHCITNFSIAELVGI